MSSFPFISHHLFVSAVASNRETPVAARQEEIASGRFEINADDEHGDVPQSLALGASTTGGTPFDVPGGEAP